MTRTRHIEGGETKTIVSEGMDLVRIAGGKIHQVNAPFERLGLLVEMGVIEPPAG